MVEREEEELLFQILVRYRFQGQFHLRQQLKKTFSFLIRKLDKLRHLS